jgi:hypothetical protein
MAQSPKKERAMQKYFIILSQLGEDLHPPEQAALLAALKKQQKPQISSIPGIPPKERNRYRVILGDRVLGNQLNLEQAVALAKRGEV